MIYSLIITFGLLFAIRGAKGLSLQKPDENFPVIWRQTVDFFLTLAIVITCFEAAKDIAAIRSIVQDDAFLGIGFFTYLFSKQQKKTEIFFISASVLAIWVCSEQKNLGQELFQAGVVSIGIALFQTFFLGLRYKLLFSRVPKTMQGWPILCLLASFISMILWGIGQLVF